MKIRHSATRTGVSLGLAAGVALFALTGCQAGEAPKSDAGTSQEQSASQGKEADSVKVTETWAKAAEAGGMTAAFGTIENTSDKDVTIVSATSNVSPKLELHETVATDTGQMMMREVEGGFVIKAGAKLELVPGGNHIMLFDLPKAVKAGDEATITLTFSDGSTLDFTALVKDYAGANEKYQSDAEGGSMDGMDGMDHEASN